jgi:hypothetical protein
MTDSAVPLFLKRSLPAQHGSMRSNLMRRTPLLEGKVTSLAVESVDSAVVLAKRLEERAVENLGIAPKFLPVRT